MKEILLEVEHLTKKFQTGGRSFAAVEDVSFTLQRGSCLGLVGESGSGKTTVARMLSHFLEPDFGKIYLQGEEITHAKGKTLRDVYGKLQMVFQNPAASFDSKRTLGDGVGEPLRNRGMASQEVKKRVAELLEKCGLPAEYAGRCPHQVSGGQCQRAAIARALAVSPSVLICDEALSALDEEVQSQILQLLGRLKTEENLAILFICHDLRLVQALCDEVLVLYGGRVVDRGSTAEVLSHPTSEYTKKLLESARWLAH